MASNVNITSKGIQKILRKYTKEQALAEYIWNGFDAKADTINLNYTHNALGSLEYIEIIDNGCGINFEELKTKFDPFYESEKAIEISAPTHTSTMHGKNGVGRLTFFKFAHSALWQTTYSKDNKLESCTIAVDAGSLNNYQPNKLLDSLETNTGTKVSFVNVNVSHDEMESVIIPFLISEFCWFLELNRKRGFKIVINNIPLDYNTNIAAREDDIDLAFEKSAVTFKFRYVQWKNPLHKEFSKYYFLNSNYEEVYKDFTTLNKKGDDFFHSVYIESEFFKDFNFKSSDDDGQEQLFGKAKSSPEYKFLIKKVNEYLRAKRKPYLRSFASKLVEKYEQDGVLPVYANEWEEKFKKPQLEETIIGLYEAQPKLFTNLNIDQKKTFVRFLDLLLDSNERDRTFTILDGIIELEPEERQDLAELFKTTRLNRIIETIKLIEDRYKAYYQLKDLVFNPDLNANEVQHLQKFIEGHYWIFGEQYHLVTAAEPKFEEALRRYIYYLTEKDTSPEIEHPHKLKEMDIFACRQNMLTNKIENIVVELKHPLISLGQEQYSQVHKYLQVIAAQPEFNANNMYWEFYLIGNKFNTSNYIEDLINTNKNHGIPSLVLSKSDGRIKVYAKTWSEIFADFELKHKHLDEKLKLERDQLANELTTANKVVESSANNSAIQPKQIEITA